jgi:hypothetical protein
MRRLFLFSCFLFLTAQLLPATTVSRHHRRHAASATARRAGANGRHRASAKRVRLTRLRRARLLRMAMASPIHGTHDSLIHQNIMVGQDQLERIQDDQQLVELITHQQLVELPEDGTIIVNNALPPERRYCRPWTRSFLASFAQDHFEEFHRPLMVTSAVRTVDVQRQLRRWNVNAAALDGDTASPHLTGAAVDISKVGMTRAELNWARQYLLKLVNDGTLDAEEEFLQPVFHVTVYKSFDPSSVPAPTLVDPVIQLPAAAPLVAPAGGSEPGQPAPIPPLESPLAPATPPVHVAPVPGNAVVDGKTTSTAD